jgi:hypothetical protein
MLLKRTNGFLDNAWDAFTQGLTVDGQTRVDVDFNEPDLHDNIIATSRDNALGQ